MLNITNTGSIADIIREVRDIPMRVVPYAASTALTRTAQRAAKDDLPAEMRRVFDRPTAYTLNSLFVKPSTAQTLSARVMVKDTAGSGVVPEKFLQPEVEGGPRREKGMEKALRYAGLLRSGERVIPSNSSSILNQNGNVSSALIRKVLNSIGKPKSQYFIGTVGVNKTHGIWDRGQFRRKRSGKNKTTTSLRLLFIITQAQPQYRPRLDFTGVVERVAEKHFRNEFAIALNAMLKRSS